MPTTTVPAHIVTTTLLGVAIERTETRTDAEIVADAAKAAEFERGMAHGSTGRRQASYGVDYSDGYSAGRAIFYTY